MIQRRRKNVITMSSQAITFLIECFASIVIMILTNLKVKAFEAASFPLFLVICEALITISHVWASPELRRFYWDDGL